MILILWVCYPRSRKLTKQHIMVEAGSVIISVRFFWDCAAEGPTVLAAKKTVEGLRDRSPSVGAGLQDG